MAMPVAHPALSKVCKQSGTNRCASDPVIFSLHVGQQTQALVNLRPRITGGPTHQPGAWRGLENFLPAVWSSAM